MDEDASRTILLICDVWDNHWCADVRRRTESLVERINKFAKVVRKQGGRVLHCPSETVDTYYETWPQRQVMLTYPAANATIYDDMVEFTLPLDTTHTSGCPDMPKCDFHCGYTKQHITSTCSTGGWTAILQRYLPMETWNITAATVLSEVISAERACINQSVNSTGILQEINDPWTYT